MIVFDTNILSWDLRSEVPVQEGVVSCCPRSVLGRVWKVSLQHRVPRKSQVAVLSARHGSCTLQSLLSLFFFFLCNHFCLGKI